MPNASTQQYIDTITTPPVKSLASFQADVIAFQATVPLYSAELALEMVPLQNAVLTETDPAYTGPLQNAYQRTQFLQNRLEKLSALLQEVRVGLIDLAADQTAVEDGGYPAPLMPTPTPTPTP
jgi:hypothetical protein